MHTCRPDPMPILWWTLSVIKIVSVWAAAGFELPSISYGAICKERAGKKCRRAWKSSFALNSTESSCYNALWKPSSISVSGFSRCARCGTVALVSLWPHRALQELRASELDWTTLCDQGGRHYVAFRDKTGHFCCGTARLYFFEVWYS